MIFRGQGSHRDSDCPSAERYSTLLMPFVSWSLLGDAFGVKKKGIKRDDAGGQLYWPVRPECLVGVARSGQHRSGANADDRSSDHQCPPIKVFAIALQGSGIEDHGIRAEVIGTTDAQR